MTSSPTSLPLVNNYEEVEKLKNDTDFWKDIAKEIFNFHQLPKQFFTPLEGTNIVFASEDKRVIKIFPPIHKDHFITETLVLKQIHNKLSVCTPFLEHMGEIDGWPYIIMTQLEGASLEGLWEKLDENNKLIIMRELGKLIHEVHSLPTQGLEKIDCHWEQFIQQQIHSCLNQHQATQLSEKLAQQIPNFLTNAKALLPVIKTPVILTGEYTPMNLLVKQMNGIWHIHGLIDFGDSMLGLPEYDLLGPGAFLVQGNKTLLREFLISYGYSPTKLTPELTHQFGLLMILHRYSNLPIQIRIENWQENIKTLEELENLVWGF